MGIDLPVIWAVIIGFGLMMYVVMDGFDLGIGILFPFIRDRRDRDTMVNTVAPVWDGNETWLVLGGAALMAAFPLAYSVLLSALYIPLFFMLAGLIWRGVAFEFRFKADETHRPFWDKAFAWGSYIATFSQGVALGAFINGFKVTGASYDGGSFDWLSPFSLFTGVGLIVAYALLGCTWLIMKTEGELQHRLKALAPPVTLVLVATIVIVSVWTPLTHPSIATRWFSFPNIIIFSPVPVLVVATTWVMMRVLRNDTHALPFLLALLLLFLGYTGLAISLWPNIIPPAIRSGKRPGRRKAWASRWSVRFSSSPSSSPTPQCPITYSAERSEPARGTTDGYASCAAAAASPHWLACSHLGDERPGARHCCRPVQNTDGSRRPDRVMLPAQAHIRGCLSRMLKARRRTFASTMQPASSSARPAGSKATTSITFRPPRGTGHDSTHSSRARFRGDYSARAAPSLAGTHDLYHLLTGLYGRANQQRDQHGSNDHFMTAGRSSASRKRFATDHNLCPHSCRADPNL